MEYNIIESPKGNIAEIVFAENERIEDYRSFFDAIMESPSDTSFLHRAPTGQTVGGNIDTHFVPYI